MSLQGFYLEIKIEIMKQYHTPDFGIVKIWLVCGICCGIFAALQRVVNHSPLPRNHTGEEIYNVVRQPR